MEQNKTAMRLVNLMPLQEIDFPNQRAFDQYNKIHKLRPDTEVTVAGRKTTAGRAALNSEPVKGTSVFGKGDDDMHPKLKDLYKQQFGKEPGEEKPTPGTQFKNTENNQTMTLKKYDNLGNAIVTSDALPGYEFTWPADVVDGMIKSGQLKPMSDDEPTDNGGDKAPQKLVFPDAKKKSAEEEPFEGGDSVLNKVPELLPVGSGFTHKQTGNEIIVKGYKDNHMLVSYEKYPNKILKWPLKQFLKMTANKELQFHPKSK